MIDLIKGQGKTIFLERKRKNELNIWEIFNVLLLFVLPYCLQMFFLFFFFTVKRKLNKLLEEDKSFIYISAQFIDLWPLALLLPVSCSRRHGEGRR